MSSSWGLPRWSSLYPWPGGLRAGDLVAVVVRGILTPLGAVYQLSAHTPDHQYPWVLQLASGVLVGAHEVRPATPEEAAAYWLEVGA